LPLAIRISLAIWLVRLANSSRSRRAAAGSLAAEIAAVVPDTVTAVLRHYPEIPIDPRTAPR